MCNYRKVLAELVSQTVGRYVQPISFEIRQEDGQEITEVMLFERYVQALTVGESKRFGSLSLGVIWQGGAPRDLVFAYRELSQLCQVFFPHFNLGQVPQVRERGKLQFLVGGGELVEFEMVNGVRQQMLEAINLFFVLNLLFLSSRAIIAGVEKRMFVANLDGYGRVLETLTSVSGDMESIAMQVEKASADELWMCAQIFKP